MAEMGDFGGEGGDMGLAAALGLVPLPAAVRARAPDGGAEAAVGGLLLPRGWTPGIVIEGDAPGGD
jgi:hypothetical protein